MTARVIELIVTDLDLRGKGTKDSPCYRVTQFWTLDGRLLFESPASIRELLPEVVDA